MRVPRTLSYPLVAAVMLFILAACGADEPTLPDTTGNGVSAYLEEVDYQESWDLWPGKGELYEGVEPHGLLLTTYVNDAALEALNGQADTMPDGAIIVKENYMPDGTFDSSTVMYKVEGYNPEHNDWFWAKYAADGGIDAEGQAEGCQACHGQVQDNDYIFTTTLE